MSSWMRYWTFRLPHGKGTPDEAEEYATTKAERWLEDYDWAIDDVPGDEIMFGVSVEDWDLDDPNEPGAWDTHDRDVRRCIEGMRGERISGPRKAD